MREQVSLPVRWILTAAVIARALVTAASAQTEMIIHTFTGGSDGDSPYGALVFNAKGNLYGSALSGSAAPNCTGCGNIFQFVPGSNGTWTQNIL